MKMVSDADPFPPKRESQTRAPSHRPSDRGGFETIPFFIFFLFFYMSLSYARWNLKQANFRSKMREMMFFQRRGGDRSPIVTKSPPLFGEHQKTVRYYRAQ